ncbi:glutamyl aminopeptidase-like [Zootermopsis nevadensis]|uniref:glutamyl aminopeptidase-like n=1 Tax=Zootermopsis nevadensis TaxID=136037 RepID=UPI000B8EB63F|nr:glutamyl aminopeptidase-like [Zootermopsis nevadensis]
MATTRIPPKAERGKLFYFFVWTCLVLALLCVCLVLAVVLLGSSLSACRETTSDASSSTTVPAVRNTSMKSVQKSAPKPWETDYHLPSATDPIHYDIFLHPDLSNLTFSGKVTITIRVKNPRSFLLVNAKYLDIYETRLTGPVAPDNEGEERAKAGEVREIDIGEAFEYKPNEFWVVVIKNNTELQPGIYSLHLQFRGSLSGKIVGFYSSTYTDSKTQEKRLVQHFKFFLAHVIEGHVAHFLSSVFPPHVTFHILFLYKHVG